MDTPQSSPWIVEGSGLRLRSHVNSGTTVGTHIPKPPGPETYRELIGAHPAAIRNLAEQHPMAGLALLAIDRQDGQIAAKYWIPAHEDRPEALVVGRHTCCDVSLQGDGGLSLRHLLVIIRPLGGKVSPVFRVMDLRTSFGFFDADRHCRQALETEGPTCLQCGRFVLFLFPTGRGLLREVTHEDTSTGQRLQGPHRASLQPADPGVLLGRIELSCRGSVQTITVTRAAAERGILIGRYERCDNDPVTVLDDRGISRVHAAVLLVDGRLYVFDTASYNAMGPPGEKNVRIADLALIPTLQLGDNIAHLTWKSVDS